MAKSAIYMHVPSPFRKSDRPPQYSVKKPGARLAIGQSRTRFIYHHFCVLLLVRCFGVRRLFLNRDYGVDNQTLSKFVYVKEPQSVHHDQLIHETD